MNIHAIFDVLSALSSFAITLAVYRLYLRAEGDRVSGFGAGYVLALAFGAISGAYLFGTLNLLVSGLPGIGRSIVGALAGAIAGIELYKLKAGIKTSTGLVFVPAFTTSIVIGRLGCYFAGLDDQTYGVATSSLFGHDFGDGIRRHPVQLYESASMALFLVVALWLIANHSLAFRRSGFHVMVLVYACQRFVWEFLKPYGPVVGPFNTFHLLCAALIGYAVWMIARAKNDRSAA